jgi:hypothetical protein
MSRRKSACQIIHFDLTCQSTPIDAERIRQLLRPLLVLDEHGRAREIVGLDPCRGADKPLGLPLHCFRFYPRMAWIADAITRERALETELAVLRHKLRAVGVQAYFSVHYYGDGTVEEQFGRMLKEFEQKRQLAEAGPDAIPEPPVATVQPCR